MKKNLIRNLNNPSVKLYCLHDDQVSRSVFVFSKYDFDRYDSEKAVCLAPWTTITCTNGINEYNNRSNDITAVQHAENKLVKQIKLNEWE